MIRKGSDPPNSAESADCRLASRGGAAPSLFDDRCAHEIGNAFETHSLRREIVGVSVLIELGFLNGRSQIPGIPLHAILRYDSEAESAAV